MKREAVESTTIAEVGYDADTKTLEVLFVNGGLYQYFDVPGAVFEELRRAGSIGQFFNVNVRGTYRYARL